MQPVLARDCSERLLTLAKRGYDPLNYALRGSLEDVDCPVEQINDMDDLAAEAITGRDAASVRRLAEKATTRRLDDVTAGLLLHLGISPAAACGLWEILTDQYELLQITDADEDRDVMHVEANGLYWIVMLGGGVTWNSLGTLKLPALPDTMVFAGRGPLARLVSHPVLDRHRLDVVAMTVEDGFCTATVTGMRDAGRAGNLVDMKPEIGRTTS